MKLLQLQLIAFHTKVLTSIKECLMISLLHSKKLFCFPVLSGQRWACRKKFNQPNGRYFGIGISYLCPGCLEGVEKKHKTNLYMSRKKPERKKILGVEICLCQGSFQVGGSYIIFRLWLDVFQYQNLMLQNVKMVFT